MRDGAKLASTGISIVRWVVVLLGASVGRGGVRGVSVGGLLAPMFLAIVISAGSGLGTV